MNNTVAALKWMAHLPAGQIAEAKRLAQVSMDTVAEAAPTDVSPRALSTMIRAVALLMLVGCDIADSQAAGQN